MHITFALVAVFVAISSIIPGISTQKLANACKHNQFRCNDGSRCLPAEKLCNRKKDCPGGEDEIGTRQWDCSKQTTASVCDRTTEIKCRYGGCIPRSKLCDGVPDCWGGNDEATDLCFERVTTTRRPVIVNVITVDPLKDANSHSSRIPGPSTPRPVQPTPIPTTVPRTPRPTPLAPRPPPPSVQYPPGGGGCPPIQEDGSSGFQIQCKNPFGRSADCSNFLPTNSQAIYKCKNYYTAPRGAGVQTERTCQANGQWSRKRLDFTCYVQCGSGGQETTSLIVGGYTSKKGKWPWHVALYHESPPNSGRYEFFCGGTLINDRTVLTAAHCVAKPSTSIKRDPREIRVVLGKFYRNYSTRDNFVQERYVQEIAMTEDYNHITLQDDIALMWLDKPVEITERVRPVCLPKREDQDVVITATYEGTPGQLVGWGRTANGFIEDLQETRLPIVKSQDCKNAHPTYLTLVRKSTFCAGYTNGTSACDGDSGGSLIFPDTVDRKHWAIQGIVSAGISKSRNGPGCDPKYYSVFTKVSEYSDWIDRQIDRFRALR